MTFGMRVENENNYVQIDSGYSNYVITKTGTTSVPLPGIEFDNHRVNYPASEFGTALVFVKPEYNLPISYWGFYPGGYGGQTDSSQTEFEFRIHYLRQRWRPINDPQPPRVNVEYFTAAEAGIIAPQSGWGLEIYRENEKLVYSSQVEFLKIVRGVPFRYGDNSIDVDLPPPPAGKKYYTLLNQMGLTALVDIGDWDADSYSLTIEYLSEVKIRITTLWAGLDSTDITVRADPEHTPVILIALK